MSGTTRDHGRLSQEIGSPAIREDWQRAAQESPSPSGGVWVPWKTVHIRKEILPRLDQENPDAVERYREKINELPPIVVQRDTFVLVDGYHRLLAASKVSDFVRIAEIDVPDDELEDRAFEENEAHGLPLCMKERVRAGQRALIRHSDWSDTKVAQWAGVSRQAVFNWRHKAEGKTPTPTPSEETAPSVSPDQPVNGLQVDPEIAAPTPQYRTTVGVDNRVRQTPVGGRSGVQPAPKPSANGHQNGERRAASLPSWDTFHDTIAAFIDDMRLALSDDGPFEADVVAQAREMRKAAKLLNDGADALEASVQVPR